MIDRMDITDPKAAAAFAHPRSRAILLDLAGSERTLGALADATGASLTLLHYHLGRLRKLGLVEIVRVQARPGRAVKVYRAVARSFFVPAYLADQSVGNKLSEELSACLERARMRDGEEGVLYSCNESSGPRMRRIGGPVPGSAAELWCAMSLSEADARRLAAEIRDLLRRYEGRKKGRAKPYLAHAALAPRH